MLKRILIVLFIWINANNCGIKQKAEINQWESIETQYAAINGVLESIGRENNSTVLEFIPTVRLKLERVDSFLSKINGSGPKQSNSYRLRARKELQFIVSVYRKDYDAALAENCAGKKVRLQPLERALCEELYRIKRIQETGDILFEKGINGGKIDVQQQDTFRQIVFVLLDRLAFYENMVADKIGFLDHNQIPKMPNVVALPYYAMVGRPKVFLDPLTESFYAYKGSLKQLSQAVYDDLAVDLGNEDSQYNITRQDDEAANRVRDVDNRIAAQDKTISGQIMEGDDSSGLARTNDDNQPDAFNVTQILTDEIAALTNDKRTKENFLNEKMISILRKAAEDESDKFKAVVYNFNRRTIEVKPQNTLEENQSLNLFDARGVPFNGLLY